MTDSVSRRTFLLGLAGMTATVTLPLGAQNLPADFQPFSFAFVSGVHLATGLPDSYKLVHESQLFLQDLVRQLTKANLDFVVFGGDQVDVPGRDEVNWQLFLDIAQGLPCPWNFVLGECDITDQLPVDKMKTYGPDWKGKGLDGDRPYWSMNPVAGVHIVGLDTSRPHTTMGDISPRQLEWLKKDLAANRLRFTIVFSHHPLLPPPPFDGGGAWDEYIVPQQGPAVREILGRFPKVRLVVSGHVHVSKLQKERDVWYVASPSLDVYPCAYRIFRVTPETITMETYQVSFEALIKKAQKNLEASSTAFRYNNSEPWRFVELAAGERLDNDALLPLVGATSAQPLPKRKKKKEKAEKEPKPRPQPKKEKPGKPKKDAPDTPAKGSKQESPTTGPTEKPTPPQTEPEPQADGGSAEPTPAPGNGEGH